MQISKQQWDVPQLIVHGDVETITQQQQKVMGLTDGNVLQGVGPIRNAS